MKTKQALSEFKQFLKQNSVNVDLLSAYETLKVMAKFYQDVKADDVNEENSGDMLLFQWGVYDWGQGEFFEYNITRQLIPVSKHEDDLQIMQLSLTLQYQVNENLKNIDSGNYWCKSKKDIDKFTEYVQQHKSSIAIKENKPEKILVKFENAE